MLDTNAEEFTIFCKYLSVETAWTSIKEGTKAGQYQALQKAIKKGKPNADISQVKVLLHRLSLRGIKDVNLVILESTAQSSFRNDKNLCK